MCATYAVIYGGAALLCVVFAIAVVVVAIAAILEQSKNR